MAVPKDAATTSADATAGCEAPGNACSAAAHCCSLLCVAGQCVDPSPPAFDPPCAGDRPVQGGACVDGAVCEFGASPVVRCDEVDACKDGRWQVSTPALTDPACSPAPGSCPSSLAGVPVGQACAPPDVHCDYPDRRCECAQNATLPGWPATWRCPSGQQGIWAGDARCPMPRPRLGTPCSAPGITCDYGACAIRGGNREGCMPLGDGASALDHGIWVDQPVDCSCPKTVPAQDARCTRQLLACEYGSSNLPGCDTIATCLLATSSAPNIQPWDGTWDLQVPDGGAPCAPAPAGQCPAPGQPIQGTSCNSPSLDCDYPDKRCECASGPTPQSATTWRCTDPLLAGPGCGARPRLGAACPQDGLVCNYGACEIAGGSVEQCEGVWKTISDPLCQIPACPPDAPAQKSPCFAGLCEYGTSNVASCDTIATCWQNAWQLSNPDAGGASCGTPAQDPGPPCPKPRPRLGSACTQEGLVCTYGPCGSSAGEAQMCWNAVWAPVLLDCSPDAGPE
jgi:hypothetical protein